MGLAADLDSVGALSRVTIDILPRPFDWKIYSFLRSNPCFFGLFLHAGEDLRDGERGGLPLFEEFVSKNIIKTPACRKLFDGDD